MIVGPFNSGVAAGGAGVATANVDSTIIIKGYLIGLYVRYNDAPPAGTTDVLIATKGTNAPAQTLFSLANAATDGWFQPRVPVHLAATGAAITDGYDTPLIDDFVNFKILQANNGDSVDVWLQIDPSE